MSKMSKPCPYCGATAGLPHQVDDGCLREVDRELEIAVRTLRELTRRKGTLLRARIRARQQMIAGRAGSISATQRRLAGALGPARKTSPLAVRRFGRGK